MSTAEKIMEAVKQAARTPKIERHRPEPTKPAVPPTGPTPTWSAGRGFVAISPVFVEKMLGKTMVVLDSDLEEIATLEARYDALHEQLMLYTTDKEREAYRAQNAALAQTGKQPDNVWSREDFTEDYKRRRTAIKAALREVREQARPVALRVLDRVSDLAAKRMVEEENFERERMASFGLPFSPSPVLVTLDALRCQAGMLVSVTGKPSEALASVGLSLKRK